MKTDKSNHVIEKLINRIKKGDRNAIKKIAELLEGNLMSTAMNIVHDRELAREAVQNTYSAIVRSADTFRRSENAIGWIFTIVRNKAIDIYNREKPHIVKIVSLEKANNVAVEPSLSDMFVREILRCLDKHDRDVMVARVFMKMTFREIGEWNHTSKSTAERDFRRICQFLRENYKKDE